MDRLHPDILFTKDAAMPLTLQQGNLHEVSSPSCCAGRKGGAVEQALLWSWLQEEPEGPRRVRLDKVAERQSAMAVRLRHGNRWRATGGMHRRQGRPGHAQGRLAVACGAEVVRVTPHVSLVGVHLFAHWLDQQDPFEPAVAQLQQAVETSKQRHPAEAFALLHHREPTRRRRWPALCFAPLWGIERLRGCDTHAPPLETLVGRGYPSATLRQFLGQLERRGAAEVLRPVLAADQAGQRISGEGPMMASGSRLPRHKGKITMLGRLMAGSQAVMAHDDTGQAVFVASEAPDLHLSQIILFSGQPVAEATGSALVVIDRAVNAVALAEACDEQGLGWLCMLDANAQAGVERCAAT
jgi:hypothetical protein